MRKREVVQINSERLRTKMNLRKIVEYRDYDPDEDGKAAFTKLWSVNPPHILVSHRIYLGVLRIGSTSFKHNHPDFDRAKKKNI